MSNTEPNYRKMITWWFAELARESEVDRYLSIFPMLNSRLSKFAIGILLWNLTGKIDINNSEDVGIIQKILNEIAETSKHDLFDETFNELTPEEVIQALGSIKTQ